MVKTAKVARDFHGQKLYQERARAVLPILVRQAEARQPVFYEALAQEIKIPNPRNLNYPLGCIGTTLNEIGEEWGSDVPPIEALVVNQTTRLPGPGFDSFLIEKGESWDNKEERKALIEQYWARIYGYPYWDDILKELNLKKTVDPAEAIIGKAGAGGGGEGPEHLTLKLFVCANPKSVGLRGIDHPGKTEHCLPSGDSIDVVFDYSRRVHAVEVKPKSSPESDLARGLFQCVKYRAVLQALARYEHDKRNITVCLALGGSLPARLVPLRNSLNIDVFENLSPSG
jgi:hypothetical protein